MFKKSLLMMISALSLFIGINFAKASTCSSLNINYYTNGGNLPYDGQGISFNKSGSTPIELPVPTHEDEVGNDYKITYHFGGWYYDPHLALDTFDVKKLEDFDDTFINSFCNISLYAKWVEIREEITTTKAPTNTPTPIPTNTPIPVPTNTPIPIPTNTPTPVPTTARPVVTTQRVVPQTTTTTTTCTPTIKIHYNTNGGSIENEEVVLNSVDSLNLLVPTKDGSSFAGWYFDSSFIRQARSAYDQAIYILSENQDACETVVELYAKWGNSYSENGVLAILSDTLMNNVSKINVKRIDDTKSFDTYKEIADLKKVAYEISLLDNQGNSVSLNETIQLIFDIPDGYNKNRLLIYRVDNNKLVSYNVRLSEGKAKLETNTLGTFILAEQSSSKVVKKNNNNVVPIVIGTIIILGIIAGVTIIVRRIIKRNEA